MNKGADRFVRFSLAATKILAAFPIIIAPFVILITLIGGDLKTFLLFFGPIYFVPGVFGVAAMWFLRREKPVAACLSAAFSLAIEIFAFAVIWQMH